MKFWQLQEAKAKLSSVVKNVLETGPQGISIHGLPKIILMSTEEYEKLTKKKKSFYKFIKSSPLNEVELDLERNKSKEREVDL